MPITHLTNFLDKALKRKINLSSPKSYDLGSLDTRREAATRDHWIHKNQGSAAGPPHPAQALPGEHAPPAAAHRHHQWPFFQPFLIPETLRQRPAVPGALCARPRKVSWTTARWSFWDPGRASAMAPCTHVLSLGFALRKGRVLPSWPPAAALPHRLWELSYCPLTAGFHSRIGQHGLLKQ